MKRLIGKNVVKALSISVLAVSVLAGCSDKEAETKLPPATSTEAPMSEPTKETASSSTEAPKMDATESPMKDATNMPKGDSTTEPKKDATVAPKVSEDDKKAGETKMAEDGMKTYTAEELKKFDGKEGRKAYVAVNGVVYDVTGNKAWQNGEHNGTMAGIDATEAIKKAPHGLNTLKDLVKVGMYKAK